MRSWGKTPVLLFVVSLVLVGCQPNDAPSATLAATQALSDQSIEMLTTKNFDLMDQVVAPNYTRHDPLAPEPITSRVGLRSYYTDFLATAYPDWQVTVEEVIVAENRTASRWRFAGTNTGPRGDLPPTGQSVEISGLSVAHIENGMIVEEWVLGDGIAVLEQLGFSILPPEEPGGETGG